VYFFAGGQGAYFTRWGRKDCPANVTELLYTGKLLSFFATKFDSLDGVIFITISM